MITASIVEQPVYHAVDTQVAVKAQAVALTMQNAHADARSEGKVNDSGNFTKGSS